MAFTNPSGIKTGMHEHLMTSPVVEIAFTNYTPASNSPARASEDFHGGCDGVYTPSWCINCFARVTEDFHGG